MVLPVTPSLFARDLSGAYKKAERKNRPDGFFETLAKGVATGVATGLGQEAASQLISKPLEAYNAAQEAKRDEFLATENIADAKRNNALQNNFLNQYRTALNRSEANGTDFNVEFAKEDLFTRPAIEEFRQRDFVRKGKTDAFTDDEIIQYTMQDRIDEVKRNRAKFDSIYNQAKGIRNVEQFTNFLNKEAPKTRGLILGVKDRLTSLFKDKSVGQLAEERVLNDPRYQKSLEALQALKDYRSSRNEGEFIQKLRSAKLADDPDLKPFYQTVESTKQYKKHGKGYAQFETRKVANELAGTTSIEENLIKGSEVTGLSNLDRVTNINTVFDRYGFNKDAKKRFTSLYNERLREKFPDGKVMTLEGVAKPYDYDNVELFATDQGVEANRIGLEILSEMASDATSYRDFSKEKADRLASDMKLKLEYMNLSKTIKGAYSNNVKEVNGVLVVFKDGKPVTDTTSAYYQAEMNKFIAGKDEEFHLQTLFDANHKIEMGLLADQIDYTIVERPLTIGGQEVMVKEKRAIPRDSIAVIDVIDPKTGESRLTFQYPDNVSEYQQGLSMKDFAAFEKGEKAPELNQQIREAIQTDLKGEETTGTRTETKGTSKEIKERPTLKPPPDLDNISGRGGLLERDSRRKERERFNKILAEVNKMPTKLQRRKNPELLKNWTKRNEIYRTEGIPYDIIAQTDPNLYRMLASN
jgi:hypothetical protein